jgi:hypothetical protein
MSFLLHLKRSNFSESTRWIIKYNSKDQIKDIKQLFNPEEYRNQNPKKRKIYNKQELIKLLETK